jgi:hypothetical protein
MPADTPLRKTGYHTGSRGYMRIDGDLAVKLASQLSYIDMLGLNGVVLNRSIRNNTGARFLEENGNRTLDLDEIVRLLEVSQNKYLIIMLLPRSAMLELLTLLEKDQLLMGLMLFPKEKLLQLMTYLPKEMLIKMLLHLMRLEDLIKRMPTGEIFNILRDKKVTERVLMQMFKTLAPYYLKYLHFILMKMTGKNVSKLQQAEVLDSLKQFKKRQLLEGMKMLPFKALQPFILFLVQQDPELLMNLSGGFIFKLFDEMPKPMLVEGFREVPDDLIIEFLNQLPDMFLAMVVDQVDPNTFESYLLSEQPGLLQYLAESQQLAA